jgi:hypothetical protein
MRTRTKDPDGFIDGARRDRCAIVADRSLVLQCSLRRDGKLLHVDRAGHPSVSSFFNTDDTKEEYNASEPVNDGSVFRSSIRGEAGCDTRVGNSPFFDPLCCRGT